MEFSSKLLQEAVNEMSQLPGIGKRTALRLVLHLLRQPKEQTSILSQALSKMGCDIIILDDAFQHRSIKGAVNLVCSTFSQPFYQQTTRASLR